MNQFHITETWLSLFQDKIMNTNETLKQYLSDRIDCVLIHWLKITSKGLERVLKVSSHYLDLVTNCILLSIIITVLGTSFSFKEFFSFITAWERPLVIFSAEETKRVSENKNQKMILFLVARLTIILLCPLVPAMIIFSNENAKDERELLKNKCHKIEDFAKASILEECELLTKHIDETRLALLTFRRNERSMELVIQQTITLIMVLLSETQYPIESGLQSIFHKESDSNSTSLSSLFDWIGLQDTFHEFEVWQN